VFLQRLESGLLLFQTPQGLVPVELSFWQRVYLLWTFRNFRQLSFPLLNTRQVALVNALARKNAGAVPHAYDPLLVIGVVENFSPPPTNVHAVPPTKIHPVPAAKKHPPKGTVTERVETARKLTPDRSFAPGVARPKPAISRLTMSRLETAVGVLLLCISAVVVLHRIGRVSKSPAQHQPRAEQSNLAASNSSHFTETAVTENPSAITGPAAVTPPSAIDHPSAGPEVAFRPSSVKPASITSVIPVPKQKIRVHDTVSIPKLPLSVQGSSIRATRPPLRFVYPIYSDIGARGGVAMTAQVNSDGTVHSVKVVSGNRALAPAAVRAIRQWRYRPYLKDGQPVATETNIVISFFSDDAISMSFPPSIPVTR